MLCCAVLCCAALYNLGACFCKGPTWCTGRGSAVHLTCLRHSLGAPFSIGCALICWLPPPSLVAPSIIGCPLLPCRGQVRLQPAAAEAGGGRAGARELLLLCCLLVCRSTAAFRQWRPGVAPDGKLLFGLVASLLAHAHRMVWHINHPCCNLSRPAGPLHPLSSSQAFVVKYFEDNPEEQEQEQVAEAAEEAAPAAAEEAAAEEAAPAADEAPADEAAPAAAEEGELAAEEGAAEEGAAEEQE